MTIYELGMEYGAAAALLLGRIAELEQALAELEGGEPARQQLEGRLRPLRAMYRETRAVARHLQNYYLRTGAARQKRQARGRRR